MTIDDTLINSRTLLKCCAMTLIELASENPSRDFADGALWKCKFSKGNRDHTMLLLSGVWRWADPEAAHLGEREKLRKQGLLWDHVRGRERD